jgi:hypothetical protein
MLIHREIIKTNKNHRLFITHRSNSDGSYSNVCGYVGVSRNHFLHGIGYHNISFRDIFYTTKGYIINIPEILNGNLTYTGRLSNNPLLDSRLWYFGIDEYLLKYESIQENIDYVVKQTHRLSNELYRIDKEYKRCLKL